MPNVLVKVDCNEVYDKQGACTFTNKSDVSKAACCRLENIQLARLIYTQDNFQPSKPGFSDWRSLLCHVRADKLDSWVPRFFRPNICVSRYSIALRIVT